MIRKTAEKINNTIHISQLSSQIPVEAIFLFKITIPLSTTTLCFSSNMLAYSNIDLYESSELPKIQLRKFAIVITHRL